MNKYLTLGIIIFGYLFMFLCQIVTTRVDEKWQHFDVLINNEKLNHDAIYPKYFLNASNVVIKSDLKLKKFNIIYFPEVAERKLGDREVIFAVEYAENDNIYEISVPQDIVQKLNVGIDYVFEYEAWGLEWYPTDFHLRFTDDKALYDRQKLAYYGSKYKYLFYATLVAILAILPKRNLLNFKRCK